PAETSRTPMPQAQDQAPKQAEPVKSVPFLPMLDLSPLPQQDSKHGQEAGVCLGAASREAAGAMGAVDTGGDAQGMGTWPLGKPP
ncbi:hypothetical protein, partial [Thiomonas sp.]